MKSVQSFDHHHLRGGGSKEEAGTILMLLEGTVEGLEKNLAKLEESFKGLQREIVAVKKTTERPLLMQEKYSTDLPRQEAPAPEKKGKHSAAPSPGETQRRAARELYEGMATTPEDSDESTEASEELPETPPPDASDEIGRRRRPRSGTTLILRGLFGACFKPRRN